ncbi:histidinol-phosphate transaminase [Alkalimarinus sediminis]|uniref:Histidinol-phosphate aminotransferase n=1 Tax=Alkalimarinus sediminis TaxID=1632866 RepID=A0A9E8HK10_9ALTE|nr:histidinol-phosphate transaminase [Alkalimarinus sediminis]UZW75760.1 histidinol-phosphate transaminase [Alkalimarinus sediminis]
MSRFWSAKVHELTPYVPGEQPKVSNLIKLNTNENPYGPSPKVLEALKAEAGDTLRLYPDPNADNLKQALATYYKVTTNQVFVGNGSDEVLAHTFQGLLKQDKPLMFPDITYSFYPVYCGLYDIEYVNQPLTDSFEIDLNQYPSENGGIIFPNPNAPTGRVLPLSEIRTLLERNSDSVVVVDEAYIDFGGESAIALVNDYPNLLVIQTLSKSRSLAGLRVGFAVGNPELIDGLERVKNSFNSYPLDRFAISGAVAAIEDHVYFEQTCKAIMDSRNTLTEQLQALQFEVLPSATNFVFATHAEWEASELAAKLRERSIIVRHFKQERIQNYIRISIGTNDECQALVAALREILT